MSQIRNLRAYIEKEISEKPEITLVDVIARFDFHQHAIPTLNEIRQAVRGVKHLRIIRDHETIVFVRSETEVESYSQQIQGNDLKAAYGLYLEKLK